MVRHDAFERIHCVGSPSLGVLLFAVLEISEVLIDCESIVAIFVTQA